MKHELNSLISKELFDTSDFAMIKAELWAFYKAATSERIWTDSFDVLITLKNQLNELITTSAAWHLAIAKKSDYRVSQEALTLRQVFAEAQLLHLDGRHQLRRLSSNQTMPEGFFDDFFQFLSPNDWGKLILEMFEYALHSDSISELYGHQTVLEAYELLDGLLETFYSLSLESENKESSGLLDLIELIKKVCKPLFIYQYANDGTSSGCQLLLIDSDENPRSFNDVSDTIQALVDDKLAMQILVVKYSHFSKQVELGTPFYLYIRLIADPVFTSATPLPIYPRKTSMVESLDRSRMIFSQLYDKAHDLFTRTTTAGHQLDGQVNLFLLHQSLELSCRALAMAFTYKEKKTHHLPSLVSHLKDICPELHELFSSSTAKTSLEILNNAYISSRYENYKIAERDIELISHLVKQAVWLIKANFESKISQLENRISLLS
ncbi:HEPN domain-containing protein [Pedobacter sp. SYP-B3415]|uniref:HEPN domain-containing protein n=1 Tax=Pedobacter sp. SYP-B3415 TaxID=2496641 RepID=UPI00101CBDAA|nr:HEPN domain-containing protein [Pedobacter sp. SYP-B3415]